MKAPRVADTVVGPAMAINAVASTADRALEIGTFHENASGVIAPIAPLSLDGD